MIIGGGSNLFKTTAVPPKAPVVIKPVVISPAIGAAPIVSKKKWKYTYLGVGGTDVEIFLERDPSRDTPSDLVVDDKGAAAGQVYRARLYLPEVVARYHQGFTAWVYATTRLPDVYVIEVFFEEEYIGNCNMFAPHNWGIHTPYKGERFFGDKLGRTGNKTLGWVQPGGTDPLDATEAVCSLIKFWDTN